LSGFISLHRKIWDHWLWQDGNERYLKWWLDLLLLANYKDNTAVVKGNLVDFKRGEHHTSILTLSKRWGVDIKTATKYLNLLVKDGMISLEKSRQTGTTIKVNNYEAYQAFYKPDMDNEMDIKTDNEKDNRLDNGMDNALDNEMDINNKYNKVNKENKENNKRDIPPLPPKGGTDTKAELRAVWDKYNFEPDLYSAVKDWIKYKTEKRQQYKPQGLNSLLAQIQKNTEEYGAQTVINLINECMANNWQGIIWDRLKNAPLRGGKTKDTGNIFFDMAEERRNGGSL